MNAKDRTYHWRTAGAAGYRCASTTSSASCMRNTPKRARYCWSGCISARRDASYSERQGAVFGYVLSHPWQRRSPPPLDAKLGAIPADADTWYVHDLALLSATRGSGAGSKVAAQLADQARQTGYRTVALVSVGGSQGFWKRQGFSARMDEELAGKLKSYGDQAIYMERDL